MAYENLFLKEYSFTKTYWLRSLMLRGSDWALHLMKKVCDPKLLGDE